MFYSSFVAEYMDLVIHFIPSQVIPLVEHCFVDRGRGRLRTLQRMKFDQGRSGGRHTQHCRAGGSALFEIMVSFD
jgi:hypothetical protein